jgi:hypothetical protein
MGWPVVGLDENAWRTLVVTLLDFPVAITTLEYPTQLHGPANLV